MRDMEISAANFQALKRIVEQLVELCNLAGIPYVRR